MSTESHGDIKCNLCNKQITGSYSLYGGVPICEMCFIEKDLDLIDINKNAEKELNDLTQKPRTEEELNSRLFELSSAIYKGILEYIRLEGGEVKDELYLDMLKSYSDTKAKLVLGLIVDGNDNDNKPTQASNDFREGKPFKINGEFTGRYIYRGKPIKKYDKDGKKIALKLESEVIRHNHTSSKENEKMLSPRERQKNIALKNMRKFKKIYQSDDRLERMKVFQERIYYYNKLIKRVQNRTSKIDSLSEDDKAMATRGKAKCNFCGAWYPKSRVTVDKESNTNICFYCRIRKRYEERLREETESLEFEDKMVKKEMIGDRILEVMRTGRNGKPV